MGDVLRKSDCEEYNTLNCTGNKSLELKDLPFEFTREALNRINDFIKKTDGLN